MLRRSYRLRRRSDFARLHRAGQRVRVSGLNIKYHRNHLGYNRVAVVISTKTAKRAVVRNRCRRRVMAAFRELWSHLQPGFDIAVTVHQEAIDLSQPQLRTRLIQALHQADILGADD